MAPFAHTDAMLSPDFCSNAPSPVAYKEADELMCPPRIDKSQMRSLYWLDRARARAAAAEEFRLAGRILPWRFQVSRCRELVTNALECDPYNLSAKFMFVGCSLLLGDHEAARHEARAILSAANERFATMEDSIVLLASGIASLQAGALGDAIEVFKDAAQEFSEDPRPFVLLALALEQAGRFDAACSDFEAALQRDSTMREVASLSRQSPTLGMAERRGLQQRVEALRQARLRSDSESSQRPTGPGPALQPALLNNSRPSAPVQLVHGQRELPLPIMPSRARPSPSPAQGGVGAIRQKPFGPFVVAGGDGSPKIRDAALKDLENLLSSLLPSTKFRGPLEISGGGSSIAFEGCCSCRRGTNI